MRVNVTHTVGRLRRDFEAAPVKFVREGSKAVRRNVREGNKLARAYARGLSGPHGANYYKRITGEMTGALEGEWGPHDGGLPVGGGWRHGAPNTELERSQDVIGPKFAHDVGEILDGLL